MNTIHFLIILINLYLVMNICIYSNVYILFNNVYKVMHILHIVMHIVIHNLHILMNTLQVLKISPRIKITLHMIQENHPIATLHNTLHYVLYFI